MQNYGYTPYSYTQGYGYFPYGQRFAPQTQPMAQPTPQQPPMQMQPQMPMEMPIQDIKFVNKAEAEAHIVYPNTRVLLIDKESGMAYLKTADNMGQSATQLFKFEPINTDGTPIKPKSPTPQVNFDEFVKVEQLKDFGFVTIDEHKKVLAELEAIKKALAPKPQTKGGQI